MYVTLIDTPQFKITFTQTNYAPLICLPVVRVRFYGLDFVGWGRVEEVLAAHGLVASTDWKRTGPSLSGYTAHASNL